MITRTIRSFLPVAALACATLAFAQATPAAKPAPAPATTTAKPAVAAPAKDAGDTAAPAVAVPGPAKAEPLTAPKFKEVKFEGAKPTAKEILEKHVNATGGTKAWEAKKSMTSKGGLEVPSVGLKGSMQMQAMMPDRVTVTMDLPGMGQTRTGFDGTTGWTIDPMRGPALMEPKELANLKRDANFRRDLELAAKPDVATVAGLVEFEGRPCWQLTIAMPGNDPADNFYDKETGTMSGMSMMAATPMGQIPVIIVMTDYKDFGDVKVPTKTTTKVMGQTQLMTVDTVSWDPVDAKAFDLPTEIAALKQAPAAPAAPVAPVKAIPVPPAAPAAPATK
jgi:hypothetical protein